jgi:very-short-patch-repair endonuclease/Mor family transcriptional regulator
MNGNNKFTKEEEQQICNEYFSDERLSIITLGKKWKCNSTTIEHIIRRNKGILRNSWETRKIFSKKEEKQICKEYFSKEKPSIYTLAKKWDCSNSAIRNIIIRNGGTLRTIKEAWVDLEIRKKTSDIHKKFTKEQELQICKEYFSKEKPSTLILSKKWKCDNTTIKEILKRNDFTSRSKSEAALVRIQTHPGPYKDTKPELAMQDILTFLGIPYEKQFRLGNHLVDFHFLNTNILVEVEGDYHHGNPKFYKKFSEYQLKNKKRDAEVNKIAKENGYILLRFWENDILNNVEFVKNSLLNQI